MQRNLAELTETEFDVAVIGGGIFGVCAAWDAALRGLSVAIIERGDFGCATSANSFKMVHGGIRYLQHGDAYRIRQSSHERRTLLKIAPHLVHPLPIVVPTYGHGLKGKPILRFGMGLYDVLTCDRNRGIRDPGRQIPRSQFCDRDEVLRMFPGLDPHGLTGAAVFCDGQMYNPPRLVLAFLRSAVQAGAVAANYVEATKLVCENGKAIGVEARDVQTGSEFVIRAKVVLNAAGPYAEQLLDGSAETRMKRKGAYSRDACFVVPRRLLHDRCALAVPGKSYDADAKFSRGARHLFIAPWRDYTLIGTWHVVYGDDPNGFTVTDAELESFIDEVNTSYPGLELSLADVSLWNAGLVPFGNNPDGARHLKFGHRSRLIDHAKTHSIDNLITLIGVRFTTGRCEAARAIDLVCRKLGVPRVKSETAVTPVWGGEIEHVEQFTRQAILDSPSGIDDDVMPALVSNYGTDYQKVLRYIELDENMDRRIGGSTTISAQIRHAVRDEMAQTLADVVFRRTDLATGDYPGLAALRDCANVMSEELGWDANRIDHEIHQVTCRFPSRVVQQVDTLDRSLSTAVP